MEKYDFGLIGLGVMGRNFILNIAENGHSALGYDLEEKKVKALNKEASEFKVKGCEFTQRVCFGPQPTEES